MAAGAARRRRAGQPGRARFYRRLVDELLERGHRAVATLYHWDLPQALEDAGGWPDRDTADRFADYAAAWRARSATGCATWTTLNEPWWSAFLGYAQGRYAPGVARLRRRRWPSPPPAARPRPRRRALRAAAASVGITLNLSPRAPGRARRGGRPRALVRRLLNRLFLDPILRGAYPAGRARGLRRRVGPIDAIRDGDLEVIAAPDRLPRRQLLHPHRACARTRRRRSRWGVALGAAAPPPLTAMGWEVDAGRALRAAGAAATATTACPLFITENGAAFDDPPAPTARSTTRDRVAYLDGHLAPSPRAIADGVDVRGYFAWSLLDNFEWASATPSASASSTSTTTPSGARRSAARLVPRRHRAHARRPPGARVEPFETPEVARKLAIGSRKGSNRAWSEESTSLRIQSQESGYLSM